MTLADHPSTRRQRSTIGRGRLRAPPRRNTWRARNARAALFLAGSLAACQPGQEQPQGLVDSGVRASADATIAHPSPPSDASRSLLDATRAPPASDASSPELPSHDANTVLDAHGALDADLPRDFCGNVLPTGPGATGVLDDSVIVLPAIEQQPALRARGPAFSAEFDGRVLWVFDAAYAQNDPSSLLASNSYTTSSLEHPFVLDEASDTMPPVTWLPELPDDRAEAGADALLSAELGNPLVLPLGGTLLFYAVSATVGTTTRPLGTRVARLTPGKSVTAEPELALLMPGPGPSFHTGVAGSDGHVYLFGCARNDAAGYDCKLARAQFGAVAEAAAYQYRTVGGWSNDVTAATVVVDNLSATLSVSYNAYLQGYLLTSFVPQSNRISLQTAARPEGPWTELGQISVPMLADGDGSATYAVEHAELSSNCGKRLVLTYLAPGSLNQAELRPIQVELR